MSGFTLSPLDIALPPGAFAGGGRDILMHDGAPLCGFTRGPLRPCLHPVWTPSGHVVTAEQPADHPHHRGIWCASDHVGLLMQGPDGIERYDYNFYVDEVFQGRAPGCIRQTGLSLVAQNDRTALVAQTLDWSGPQEWAAPTGRPVLIERRCTAITLLQDAVIMDITSEVTPAGDIAVALGPTRHAWFNARLALDIAIDPTSAPVDNQRHRGAAAIPSRDTKWVDYSGPVGGGDTAGITVIPGGGKDNAWFVSDWGVITVGSIRDQARTLAPGTQALFTCRIVAHDGPAPAHNLWTDIPFVTPDALAGEISGDLE
tara:strand:- start:4436 stop:5380 length:945 start_codon:yes stop_codon:yes gene_type:complete